MPLWMLCRLCNWIGVSRALAGDLRSIQEGSVTCRSALLSNWAEEANSGGVCKPRYICAYGGRINEDARAPGRRALAPPTPRDSQFLVVLGTKSSGSI